MATIHQNKMFILTKYNLLGKTHFIKIKTPRREDKQKRIFPIAHFSYQVSTRKWAKHEFLLLTDSIIVHLYLGI